MCLTDIGRMIYLTELFRMSPIIKVFGEELFAIKETNSGNELEMFLFYQIFFCLFGKSFSQLYVSAFAPNYVACKYENVIIIISELNGLAV
jgi:hypothetical protein